MKSNKLKVLSIAVPLALASAMSQAQGPIEEIIVTASKRAQTLQEVPIAVSVTTAQTIEQAEIRDVLDLQSVVPSLRVSQLQNSNQTTFIIRGFGNGANNPGIEPSVAVFVDGVYRSRAQSQISDLPKLERIEVLRGPQSTLFGKNASAGVVSVVTAAPTYEPEGYVELGLGNYNNQTAKGYYSTGLTDKVALSVSGSMNKRDGYADNLTTGNDVSTRDRWGVRADLLIEPSDTSRIRIIADYDELDEICCTVANLVNGPTGAAVVALGGKLDAENPFSYDVYYNNDSINIAENGGITVNAEFDFGGFDVTSITAYRDSFLDQPVSDVDFGGADLIGNQPTSTDIQTFTQELRISGSTDSVDWVAGIFYFDEDIDYRNGLDFGSAFSGYVDFLTGGAGTVLGLEALLGYAPGTFHNGVAVREYAKQSNQAASVFAQMDIALNDRLTATVGLSYIQDEKDTSLRQDNSDEFSKLDLDGTDGFNALVGLTLAQQFPLVFGGLPFSAQNIGLVTSTPEGAAGFLQLQQAVVAGVSQVDLANPAQNPLLGLQALQFLPQLLGYPNAGNSGTSDDSKVTYTARLAYDWTDSINVYASLSTGYKATSWNLSRDSRPTAAEVSALTAAGTALPANLVIGTRLAGPEESEVFELGLKGSFDWGFVNIAVFDQTIEGFQSNTFTGAAFSLANAGSQSAQGLEVDVAYNPTDSLTLAFSGVFLDPKYDSFTGSAIGDISGTQPGGIHEQSLSLAATYNFELGGYDGYVRMDYQYESEVDIQDGGAANPTYAALAAVGAEAREMNVVNGSAGLEIDGWNISLWARNLFNDEYLITNFPSVAQAGSFNGYPSQPRTFGLNVRKNF